MKNTHIVCVPKLSFRATIIAASLTAAYLLGTPALQAQKAIEIVSSPLVLSRIVPLAGIEGDFDHFAVDSKRGHLFVSAEEHHSLEMFDLQTGQHLKSIPGVVTPHTLAFVPERDELFVADGGADACIVLSGEDFHETARIALKPGPDSGLYDERNKIFYVGNGGRKAGQETSMLTAVSVMDHRKAVEYELQGNNLESMAIDYAKNRLYVNVRDLKQIAVIDLGSKAQVAVWTTSEMNRNTTLTFDAVHRRVFVAGRTPGKLFVFNADSGDLVASYDCVNIADGMSWDENSHRIYITGSQGLSVFEQIDADHYKLLTQLPTNGAKTMQLVPQTGLLFTAHPKTSIDDAALLVYKVEPPSSTIAQPVILHIDAPSIERIVAAVKARHSEIVKLGVHAVPPGDTRNAIIASDNLQKIGKLSSESDLQKLAAGKEVAARIDKDKIFDLFLPLTDVRGGDLNGGFVVMEVPFAKASNEAEALAIGVGIRDEVKALIPDKDSMYKQ